MTRRVSVRTLFFLIHLHGASCDDGDKNDSDNRNDQRHPIQHPPVPLLQVSQAVYHNFKSIVLVDARLGVSTGHRLDRLTHMVAQRDRFEHFDLCAERQEPEDEAV